MDKIVLFMFERVGDVRTLGMFNFFRRNFEEISLIQSCRELNDVCFEIRFKSLKRKLIETFEGQ